MSIWVRDQVLDAQEAVGTGLESFHITFNRTVWQLLFILLFWSTICVHDKSNGQVLLNAIKKIDKKFAWAYFWN